MPRIKGGTLFSGIGAPELAMPWVDWRWCAEIDPFASAVLQHRFPRVPNLGDVTRIDPDAIESVQLVVFGSPCQSFSVAGKRLGLDDPRGNLALVALRLIGRLRPDWLVFENVPGLLSSDGGRDFGAFLGLLGECGYGFAYRIFDAQFAGIPQRRRRVFVVGHLGDWRPAAAVLFEPESLRGDPPPRREAGERVALPVASCPAGGSGWRADADTADNLIPETVGPMTSSGGTAKKHGQGWGQQDWESGYAIAQITDPLVAFGGKNTAGPIDLATAVRAKGGTGHGDFESETFVAVAGTLGADNVRHPAGAKNEPDLVVPTVFESRFARNDRGAPSDLVPPLKAQSGQSGKGDAAPLVAGMSVRRLTPVECERLQGLPDRWTAIRYRGKPAADGPRYRAIGNSMAVPVISWIGRRIQLFEETVTGEVRNAAD